MLSEYKCPAIILDIDGTLSDPTHRRDLVLNKKWDDFYDACDLDPVNEPVKLLVDCITNLILDLRMNEYRFLEVFFFTGRVNRVREKTEKWLLKKIIVFFGN